MRHGMPYAHSYKDSSEWVLIGMHEGICTAEPALPLRGVLYMTEYGLHDCRLHGLRKCMLRDY